MLTSPSGRWHRTCNPDGKPRREFESHRQLHFRSVSERLKEFKWKCFPFKIKILFKEDIEKLELEVTRLDEDTALKAAGV